VVKLAIRYCNNASMHVVNGYNLRQTGDLVSYVIESDRFDSSKQMEDMPAPKLPEIPSGKATV